MVFINKANKRRKAFFLSAIVVVVMLTAFCGCGKKEEMLLVSKNNGDTGSIGEKEGEAKAGGAMSDGAMSDGGMSDGAMSGGGMSDAADNIGEPVNGIEKITHQSIFVYICGAVYVPGVYEIKPDARIYEIVEQAGGLLPEADPTKVNLALGLVDGQMIYIPYFGEDMVLDNQNTNEDNTKIDINSATTHELCKLPGIGEAKAKAIIAYREKNGAFSKISDIKKVSGIKDALYESIKDYIVAGKGK